MRDPVWLVGVSMTPFGHFPDRDLLDLACDATLGALADAALRMTDVGTLAAGTVFHANESIGQQLLKQIGQTGIPVYNVANACATGATALDSITNIVAGSGIGLLFLIPGVDETLRVNGHACITTDPVVLDACAVKDRRPKAAVGAGLHHRRPDRDTPRSPRREDRRITRSRLRRHPVGTRRQALEASSPKVHLRRARPGCPSAASSAPDDESGPKIR